MIHRDTINSQRHTHFIGYAGIIAKEMTRGEWLELGGQSKEDHEAFMSSIGQESMWDDKGFMYRMDVLGARNSWVNADLFDITFTRIGGVQ